MLWNPSRLRLPLHVATLAETDQERSLSVQALHAVGMHAGFAGFLPTLALDKPDFDGVGDRELVQVAVPDGLHLPATDLAFCLRQTPVTPRSSYFRKNFRWSLFLDSASTKLTVKAALQRVGASESGVVVSHEFALLLPFYHPGAVRMFFEEIVQHRFVLPWMAPDSRVRTKRQGKIIETVQNLVFFARVTRQSTFSEVFARCSAFRGAPCIFASFL